MGYGERFRSQLSDDTALLLFVRSVNRWEEFSFIRENSLSVDPPSPSAHRQFLHIRDAKINNLFQIFSKRYSTRFASGFFFLAAKYKETREGNV